ncbi:AAA family ATPase [Providencia rettgeri]
MIIGIFGLSGSGKSTLSSNIIKYKKSWVHSSASSIIKKNQGVIDFEDLNFRNITNNQKLLINGVKEIAKNNTLVLELHNVVETPTSIEIIEEEVFNHLSLSFSIFIYSEPEKIFNNRINDNDIKKRNLSAIEKIQEIQNIALYLFVKKFNKNSIIISPDFPIKKLIEIIEICK